ncbi:MAG: hypothetical protein LBD16_01735 [Oscillospiraceae bacterium]|nr:hypothetical protein [Oscillospiraceae bacterium]
MADFIKSLFDEGMFTEWDAASATNLVTGAGTIAGRTTALFLQKDGGALSLAHANKIKKAFATAAKCGVPLVGVFDSRGAELAEGAVAVDAYAELFRDAARLSGVVPMIGVILGDAVGAGAILPALFDFVVGAENGKWSLIGAGSASYETGAKISAAELAGSKAHASRGGVSILAEDADDAAEKVRALLAYLPDNNLESAPEEDAAASASGIFDADSELEPGVGFSSAKTSFARLDGKVVGVVSYKDKLDASASLKAARFIRFCDSFNIPVISFIDVDGIAATDAAGQTAAIKAAANLAYAASEANVPMVRVITGNAIGAGYAATGGKDSYDFTYAYPDAVISAVSPKAAVALYRKDEQLQSTGDIEEARAKLASDWAKNEASPEAAAKLGLIDGIITPDGARAALTLALNIIETKRDHNPPKKHGNLPL